MTMPTKPTDGSNWSSWGSFVDAFVRGATTIGTSLLAATSATAARSTIGASPIAGSEGIVVHDGSTGGGTRPSGFARVRWVGGTSRPTNMVAGDVWERDA